MRTHHKESRRLPPRSMLLPAPPRNNARPPWQPHSTLLYEDAEEADYDGEAVEEEYYEAEASDYDGEAVEEEYYPVVVTTLSIVFICTSEYQSFWKKFLSDMALHGRITSFSSSSTTGKL